MKGVLAALGLAATFLAALATLLGAFVDVWEPASALFERVGRVLIVCDPDARITSSGTTVPLGPAQEWWILVSGHNVYEIKVQLDLPKDVKTSAGELLGDATVPRRESAITAVNPTFADIDSRGRLNPNTNLGTVTFARFRTPRDRSWTGVLVVRSWSEDKPPNFPAKLKAAGPREFALDVPAEKGEVRFGWGCASN